MKKIHIIHITEKLPPSLNGIGDYAYKLAYNFKEEYAIDSTFLVFDSVYENSEVIKNFHVYSLTQLKINLLEALLKILEQNKNQKNIIFLHYDRGFYDTYMGSIQKFERYYLPINLLKFLKAYKQKQKLINSNLIIFFHEFLSPKIERRRDYLLRPLQNIFMKEVIKSAELKFCSNPVVAEQISNLEQKAKIFIQPVFSNIGEPNQNDILESKREGKWVIFGSTNNLISALSVFVKQLNLIKSNQDIKILNVLGGKINERVLNLVSQIKSYVPAVNYYPNISDREASIIFASSQFCYIHYFMTNLLNKSSLIFKSGVFATACSHGVIPVFGNPGMENAIGIFEHPGFIYIQNEIFNFPDKERLIQLSKEIFFWYNNYSSIKYATKTFLNAIEHSIAFK